MVKKKKSAAAKANRLVIMKTLRRLVKETSQVQKRLAVIRPSPPPKEAQSVCAVELQAGSVQEAIILWVAGMESAKPKAYSSRAAVISGSP